MDDIADENVNYIKVSMEEIVAYPIDSLDIVEENAEIVVRGYVTGKDEREIRERLTLGSRVVEGFSCTVRKLVVTEVYGGDVKPGDILELGEYYTSEKSNDQTNIYYKKNYLPSVPGKEYIYFISKSPDDSLAQGTWGYSSSEYSRYPIPTQSMQRQSVETYTNDELTLDPEASLSTYQEIYSEVLDKYLN